MGNKKARAIASVLIFVLAAALIVTGAVGMSQRDSQTGDQILTAMRTRSVLIATGEGAVESYVTIAADEARTAAQAAGARRTRRRRARSACTAWKRRCATPCTTSTQSRKSAAPARS